MKQASGSQTAPQDQQAGALEQPVPHTNATQTTTTLEVDGQDIPVPANGSTQRTITTGSATTTIDTSSVTDAYGSSVNINVQNSSISKASPDSTPGSSN